MQGSTLVGLAWPLVFLIIGVTACLKLAPAATQFVVMMKSRQEAELEEQRLALQERETAARIAAGLIQEEIEARKNRLLLETVRLETERQAIEDDPDLIKQLVEDQRGIDLKAYAALANERARAQLPVKVAELNEAGYQRYLSNCHYHSRDPLTYEGWCSRG